MKTADSETRRTDQPSTLSDFLDATLGTDTDSLTDARRAEVVVECVHDALENLTPRQRFVIECAWGIRDGYEYSLREIAGFMGVHYNAVYKHYHAGMRRIGGQLAPVR